MVLNDRTKRLLVPQTFELTMLWHIYWFPVASARYITSSAHQHDIRSRRFTKVVGKKETKRTSHQVDRQQHGRPAPPAIDASARARATERGSGR